MHSLSARPRRGCGRVASVMERAEDLVPRHFSGSVVAFEIPVVKLVEKVSRLNPLGFGRHDAVESGMRKCRIQ